MATFTMELRQVNESLNGDIGLSQYPIFDATYRGTLNDKIKRRYWYSEIGFETPDMFVHRLDTRMREIMPYYNQLFLSEKIKYDPLETMNIKTVATGINEQESDNTSFSESNAQSTSKSRAVNSDFPQQMLSENGDYATGASDAVAETGNSGEGRDTAKATGKSDSRSESTQSGYSGVAPELIMAYRNALLNIDLLIINDLADLFMGILNTDNSFTGEDFFNVTRPYWF